MRFSEQEAKIGVSLRVGIIRSYIVCYMCICAICTGKGPKIKISKLLLFYKNRLLLPRKTDNDPTVMTDLLNTIFYRYANKIHDFHAWGVAALI